MAKKLVLIFIIVLTVNTSCLPAKQETAPRVITEIVVVEVTATPYVKPTEPTWVELDCPECLEEGMLINLWSDFGPGNKVIDQFEHGTLCIYLAEVEGDPGWYKVRCKGVEGWLTRRLAKRLYR
jgi:hypothetical protein